MKADEAKEKLSQLANMLGPWAVRIAATLRLADLMAAGVTRVDDLAARTDTDADALRGLLTYLTKKDVFRNPAPDHYESTEVGRLLEDDHPTGERAKLDLEGVIGRMDRAWAGLPLTVRTGRPAYPEVFGCTFWEDLNAHPDLLASFDQLMRDNVEEIGPAVAAEFDWAAVSEVVDVGGGSGTLVATILGAHQHLRGTVVDLAETADKARSTLAAAELGSRSTVTPGSFFEPLPPGADVYLLSWILHDWNDRQAVAILVRCAEAAGERGVVLVVEKVLSRKEDRREVAEMDLRMLALFGSRERTLDEYTALAGKAGLTLRQARPLGTGNFLLIEYAHPAARGPAGES